MTGAIVGCRPTETGGDLTLPNNRRFLRIFVIERSLHYAHLCHLRCSESALTTYRMDNHLTLPRIDVSSHFVSDLGDCCCQVGRRSANNTMVEVAIFGHVTVHLHVYTVMYFPAWDLANLEQI